MNIIQFLTFVGLQSMSCNWFQVISILLQIPWDYVRRHEYPVYCWGTLVCSKYQPTRIEYISTCLFLYILFIQTKTMKINPYCFLNRMSFFYWLLRSIWSYILVLFRIVLFHLNLVLIKWDIYPPEFKWCSNYGCWLPLRCVFT